MTFHPCPVCGQEPVVDVLRGGLSCACWCCRAYGRDLAELARAWNGLYCANDPATVADCMEGDRCPGATGAAGATPRSRGTSSCPGCTPSCAPTAPGGPARR
ncbi:MAG: hypothetical protein IKQ60_06350 [Candidatus Methanomethylophilaceae archaeon]|nr:hypothetical protein [Candidatus Methanomethylophilaceae archaeon]